MSDTDLLLRALRMNALFSSASAAALLLAAPWIAAHLGLASTIPVYVVGAGLVLFAAQLWNIVRTRQIRGWEIQGIIGGDIAWVTGSILLVALFYSQITTIGLLIVDVVALAVLFFAIQQIRGLRRLKRAT